MSKQLPAAFARMLVYEATGGSLTPTGMAAAEEAVPPISIRLAPPREEPLAPIAASYV